jgi:hypothetical protein
MAIGHFSEEIEIAQELIEENGEKSTIRRKTDAAPGDATKPWRPAEPTFADTVVDAVWFQYDVSRVDGALIKSGDQEMWVVGDIAIVPNPTTDHVIRVGGDKWEIVRVFPLQPNEDTVIYRVQVRK